VQNVYKSGFLPTMLIFWMTFLKRSSICLSRSKRTCILCYMV